VLFVPANQIVTVDTCSGITDFNTRLTYGVNPDCATCISSFDNNGCGPAGQGSSFTLVGAPTGITRYFVLVSGSRINDRGNYTLTATCVGE
jgi:hypothetical protein